MNIDGSWNDLEVKYTTGRKKEYGHSEKVQYCQGMKHCTMTQIQKIMIYFATALLERTKEVRSIKVLRDVQL